MRIPQEFLKLSLDAVAIYFGKKVVPVQYIPDLLLSKGVNINHMKNSFDESGKAILSGADFLK
jgi:predicted transcriptional regulator